MFHASLIAEKDTRAVSKASVLLNSGVIAATSDYLASVTWA